jgi:hypothetical protein
MCIKAQARIINKTVMILKPIYGIRNKYAADAITVMNAAPVPNRRGNEASVLFFRDGPIG